MHGTAVVAARVFLFSLSSQPLNHRIRDVGQDSETYVFLGLFSALYIACLATLDNGLKNDTTPGLANGVTIFSDP